jgi:hypothetical protein
LTIEIEARDHLVTHPDKRHLINLGDVLFAFRGGPANIRVMTRKLALNEVGRGVVG